MCKSCKMDPREIARFRARQGAVEVEDFDDEPRYRHPPRKTKKVKPRWKAPGCVGNDNKAHVYVWTTERENATLFYRYYKFHPYEREVCVGCGKTRKSRHTEKYERIKRREWNKRYGSEYEVKRGEPVPRYSMRRGPSYSYWRWESFDEGFQAYRRDYIKMHGWTPAVWDYF